MANIVTAAFENNVPRADVRIVSVKAVFQYEDGSSESVGPQAVNIPHTGHYLLMSSATEKCCKGIRGTLGIQQTGYEPAYMEHFEGAKPGHCMLIHRFILGVNPTVVNTALNEPFRYEIA